MIPFFDSAAFRLRFKIAITHLVQRRRQSLVSGLGIAMGVGFFIGMSSMMGGFQKYFIDQIINVSPHIVMKDEFRVPDPQPVFAEFPDSNIELRSVKPKEERRGIKNWQHVQDEIAAMPGVAVAPMLNAQVILRYGGIDLAATLNGIVPEEERKVSNIEKDIVSGELMKLRTIAHGVILGDGLAGKLGANYGDNITVISATGLVQRMEVVGLFRTGITQVDNFQGYVLLKRAQILENRPNIVNNLRLRLQDVQKASATAGEIESRYRYRTESWEESNKSVLSIFVVQNGIMYSTVGAILIVAAFGIYNIISTVVFEKYRDIAILKSMGLSEADIKGAFLMQGLIIGIVGAFAGWILGFLLIEMLGHVEFKIDEGGFIRTNGFILYKSIWIYVWGFVFALCSSLVAAYVPSKRAARLDPVQIIRGAM